MSGKVRIPSPPRCRAASYFICSLKTRSHNLISPNPTRQLPPGKSGLILSSLLLLASPSPSSHSRRPHPLMRPDTIPRPAPRDPQQGPLSPGCVSVPGAGCPTLCWLWPGCEPGLVPGEVQGLLCQLWGEPGDLLGTGLSAGASPGTAALADCNGTCASSWHPAFPAPARAGYMGGSSLIRLRWVPLPRATGQRRA